MLLSGLSRNDTRAIESIYKDNFKVIQSMVLNGNGSYDDARDVFQEAMITLYEKSLTEGFQLNCKIGTYLYSVARNLWLKKLQRDSKFLPSNDFLDDMVPVEDDVALYEEKNREFQIMHNALNAIGEPCKSLLEAFYVKKMNTQALSQAFGYTNADNAKNQKYKCLMRLKKIFFEKYKIEEEK